MSECVPIQPVFQVMAMSRSGHHAYVEWSIAQLGGTAVHHNYVRNGKPTQSFLYEDGILQGETFDPVPDGAYETANVENVLPSDTLPFNCETIIFIRDVYNCFASRLKANKGTLNDVDIWIAQAKEALRMTEHIPNATIVKYDEWRATANWHKESIAYNRGSSFGDIINVDNRYKLYLDNSEYMAKIIDNKEAAELNDKLFGWYI